jgi:ammonia channel protein AmtB
MTSFAITCLISIYGCSSHSLAFREGGEIFGVDMGWLSAGSTVPGPASERYRRFGQDPPSAPTIQRLSLMFQLTFAIITAALSRVRSRNA